MNEVAGLAARLREKHGEPGERVTFTHVPTVAAPAEILARLRHTSLAPLLPAAGTLLTHPERPWYVPVQPVAVSDEDLVSVGVTASTWSPPSYDFTAGEVALRIVYASGEAKAQVDLRLRASDGAPASLSRSFYDHQRAETGYEGEDHVSAVPTTEQIQDFLAVIQEATGVG